MLSNAAKLNCAGPSRFRKLEQAARQRRAGDPGYNRQNCSSLLAEARARHETLLQREGEISKFESDLLDSAAVPSLATCGQRVHFRTVIPFPSVERVPMHLSIAWSYCLARALEGKPSASSPNMPASLHPSGSISEMARDGSRWLEMACGSAQSRERQSTKGGVLLANGSKRVGQQRVFNSRLWTVWLGRPST